MLALRGPPRFCAYMRFKSLSGHLQVWLPLADSDSRHVVGYTMQVQSCRRIHNASPQILSPGDPASLHFQHPVRLSEDVEGYVDELLQLFPRPGRGSHASYAS